MGTAANTPSQARVEKALQSLRAAQKLQKDRLNFGIDHVNLYVEDVEGDWLERWGEDENTPDQTPINLGQWLQQVFEDAWLAVEEALGIEEASLAVGFRTDGVKRAKLIDLGMQLGSHAVALILTIRPEADRSINILVQVHPIDDETYLPQHLKLVLFSTDGEILYKVSPRSTDNVIQIEFRGQPGEQFQIEVALGDVSVTENFVI